MTRREAIKTAALAVVAAPPAVKAVAVRSKPEPWINLTSYYEKEANGTWVRRWVHVKPVQEGPISWFDVTIIRSEVVPESEVPRLAFTNRPQSMWETNHGDTSCP